MHMLLTQPPAVSAVLFSLFGIGSYYLIPDTTISVKVKLGITTILLITYLAIEIKRLHDANPDRWLLNPAVLCSFITFILSYGVGNMLFFMPAETDVTILLQPDVTPAMLKFMLLVQLAAIAMWLGYWSISASSLAKWLRDRPVLHRLVRTTLDPKQGVVAACVLLSLASRIISIKLGVYGYGADQQRVLDTAAIRQYLTLLELSGKLGLILASLQYFRPDKANKIQSLAILAGIALYEVAFGFMSGFKSAVVMPLIIIGVCAYIMQNKIPWRFTILLPLAIIAAYAVIEPFRQARYMDADYRETSVTSIASTLVTSYLGDNYYTVNDAEESVGIGLALLARASYTYVGSEGIAFADTKSLPEGSPAFLKDIILVPLYAVIPRALWGSKEMLRHGTWYNQQVLDASELSETSIAMTPFVYLYFAGGMIVVLIGFFWIGVLQRALTSFFSITDGSLLIYLSLLSSLVIIDSVYYSILIDIIRLFVLSLIIQYVALEPSSSSIQKA